MSDGAAAGTLLAFFRNRTSFERGLASICLNEVIERQLRSQSGSFHNLGLVCGAADHAWPFSDRSC
jgi:hypothetical protein